MLNIALASVDEESLVDRKIKKLMTKSIIQRELVKGEVVVPKLVKIAPVPKRKEVSQGEVHHDSSTYGLTLDNAFTSEAILVCEYKGYEHEGMITYFKPPRANYHIEEFLKGPPLNKSLPVRYEFHEKVNQPKPADWKFSESLMPAKGSKWIIFIPNAVPIDGMFETYHGSFGRLEYNEDNLDKVLKIIEQHKGQTR